jgi:hypothetical protein
MTDRSTDTKVFVAPEIRSLVRAASRYFIKRSAIAGIFEKEGRSHYSRYEEIEGRVHESLICAHVNKKRTLALPLLEDGRGKRVLLVYGGDERELFANTVRYLCDFLCMENYTLYDAGEDIQLHIYFDESRETRSLYDYGVEFSSMLEKRIARSWKILPDPALPDEINIYKLPYFVY